MLVTSGTCASAQDAGTNQPKISFAAEVRQQYEYVPADQWGAVAPDGNGYLLQRYMVRADWHLHRKVRLFVQLKSGIENNRRAGPRPTDDDRLDLHEAFADVGVGRAGPDGTLMFRAGRQELSFGSARLVSIREDPNVRQSFDAARAIVRSRRWRLDAFVSRPAATRPGVFDDRPDPSRAFWGVYAVRGAAGSKSGVDVYYLGLDRRQARFDQGTAHERRQTVGMRIWGARGSLDYNLESAAQAGRFGADAIRAWTVASDTGWRPALPANPRVGVRMDITSGDKDAKDETLGTFNALFPKGAYFSRVDPVGPYNHIDVHPQVDVPFAGRWFVTAGCVWLWRTRAGDGLYGTAGQLLRAARGAHAKSIGRAPGVELRAQLTPRLTVTASLAMFSAGAFIRETGPSRDIRYLTTIAAYKF